MQQYKDMCAPILDHYSHLAVTLRGNTSDEIYPQIEREIVNRLGLLPGALSVPSSTSMTAAAVSRHKREQQRQPSSTYYQERNQVNNDMNKQSEAASAAATAVAGSS